MLDSRTIYIFLHILLSGRSSLLYQIMSSKSALIDMLNSRYSQCTSAVKAFVVPALNKDFDDRNTNLDSA